MSTFIHEFLVMSYLTLKHGAVITVDEQHQFSMVYFEIKEQFMCHQFSQFYMLQSPVKFYCRGLVTILTATGKLLR